MLAAELETAPVNRWTTWLAGARNGLKPHSVWTWQFGIPWPVNVRATCVRPLEWLCERKPALATAAPCVSKRGSPCRTRGPAHTSGKTQPGMTLPASRRGRLFPPARAEPLSLVQTTLQIYLLMPFPQARPGTASCYATSRAERLRAFEPPPPRHAGSFRNVCNKNPDAISSKR